MSAKHFSSNDGAHLPAHLWRQKLMGRGLPFVVRYSAAMNVAGCYDIGAAVMKMRADTTRLSCRYRTLKVLADVDLGRGNLRRAYTGPADHLKLL
jgi:hypothetical protein